MDAELACTIAKRREAVCPTCLWLCKPQYFHIIVEVEHTGHEKHCVDLDSARLIHPSRPDEVIFSYAHFQEWYHSGGSAPLSFSNGELESGGSAAISCSNEGLAGGPTRSVSAESTESGFSKFTS